MRFFRSKLRFSLRSLFLATFATAMLLQGRLSALQFERDQRRAVVVADIREQVIAAERIEPVYCRRMLSFVERRITQSPDSKLLSPEEQRALMQLVQSAHARIPPVISVALPQKGSLLPAIDEVASTDNQACPW